MKKHGIRKYVWMACISAAVLTAMVLGADLYLLGTICAGMAGIEWYRLQRREEHEL